MSEIVPMAAIEPIPSGVLKIIWKDGTKGIVDLRPVIAQGDIFRFLHQDPGRFDDVKLSDHSHWAFWLDDKGDEVDFGSHSLRQRAERQAEILRLAS